MTTTGKLQHQSVLTIHTLQAKKLFSENKKSCVTPTQKYYVIFGLKQFSQSLAKIWRAIYLDDPYADMALIEIERRLSNAQHLLDKLNTDVDKQLDKQLPGITLKISESKNPTIIPLNSEIFSTPHSIMGARLIGSYDFLIRKLYTCKSFGVINRQNCIQYRYKTTKSLRGVFSAPLLYKQFGVTRVDIGLLNTKAKDAIAVLGVVPPDILSRALASQFGPVSKVKNIEQ